MKLNDFTSTKIDPDFAKTFAKTVSNVPPWFYFAFILVLLSLIMRGHLILVTFLVIFGLILVYLDKKPTFLPSLPVLHPDPDPSFDVLKYELHEIDPQKKYDFLWTQPPLFHLIFQNRFLQYSGKTDFDTLLQLCDSFAQHSHEFQSGIYHRTSDPDHARIYIQSGKDILLHLKRCRWSMQNKVPRDRFLFIIQAFERVIHDDLKSTLFQNKVHDIDPLSLLDNDDGKPVYFSKTFN